MSFLFSPSISEQNRKQLNRTEKKNALTQNCLIFGHTDHHFSHHAHKAAFSSFHIAWGQTRSSHLKYSKTHTKQDFFLSPQPNSFLTSEAFSLFLPSLHLILGLPQEGDEQEQEYTVEGTAEYVLRGEDADQIDQQQKQREAIILSRRPLMYDTTLGYGAQRDGVCVCVCVCDDD